MTATDTSSQMPFLATLRRFDRLSIAALAMLAFWLGTLIFGVIAQDGWINAPDGRPAVGDYLGIYAAGTLADAGAPAGAYDVQRHNATVQALSQKPDAQPFPWPYPPIFLLVASALALLPYTPSMLIWTIGTLMAFAGAIARISASRRDMLLMLATPATWLNFYIGQNGALSAALFGFALVVLRAHPLIAGIMIGCLSFKPHLGLLIPIAVLAGGFYRAFAAAVLTTVVLAIVSFAVFGPEPWLQWPAQMAHVRMLIETGAETFKIQSPFGLARSLGATPPIALAIQTVSTATMIGLVAAIWRRREVAFDLKAAALVAAATLASPYLFVYDLPVLTIAQAFLLRHLWPRGVEKSEGYGLLIANLLINSFSIAPPIPLAVFGSAIVLGLILRRVWLETFHRAQAIKFSSATAMSPSGS
jgi:arabinofuranan 3-O-arabinosyltransferase